MILDVSVPKKALSVQYYKLKILKLKFTMKTVNLNDMANVTKFTT